MEIIPPVLNDEIHTYIMDGLSPDAEIHPAFDAGDIGVWQNQNGKIVNYYHTDPNRDSVCTESGLGILTVEENGSRQLMHEWKVTRWSPEESLTGEAQVEIEYRDYTNSQGRVKKRISNNPERTYKALARLAKMHLNAHAAVSAK